MANAAEPHNMRVLCDGFIFLKKNLYKLLVTISSQCSKYRPITNSEFSNILF